MLPHVPPQLFGSPCVGVAVTVGVGVIIGVDVGVGWVQGVVAPQHFCPPHPSLVHLYGKPHCVLQVILEMQPGAVGVFVGLGVNVGFGVAVATGVGVGVLFGVQQIGTLLYSGLLHLLTVLPFISSHLKEHPAQVQFWQELLFVVPFGQTR